MNISPLKRRTLMDGTWTKSGFIRHARVIGADGTAVDAPVCINHQVPAGELPLAVPSAHGGFYFSLPGGERIEVHA